MTRISVVIPAWQAAGTIAETLASVAAQTRPADEVIIVDDGSTDGTAEVARAALPSARIIRHAHGGAAAALNAGFAAAEGDLLAPLDADDLWLPGKLAAQEAALMRAPPLAGVGGLMETFFCASMPPQARAAVRLPVGPSPWLLSGALLLRRAAYDAIGPHDEALRAGQSIDWMHRARLAGLAFEVLPEVVLRRRIRQGSLSSRAGGADAAFLAMARRAIERRRAAAPPPKEEP
ncbi:glycosyltransferase family 2 protein [Sediminicoccus rosea]|jgi:glycosyltransferase involved in cell wall biosynthesis|uniref:Glycosyltransferase family A protein n=1 Tax=Sediminicoccus rosea TaxID=1225128 RepID=A0ABZ0PBH5_9PROT|nr:glycosyltransferase family A protein [Sediminicoccus rosea]WPB82959.1 glycosyltransferase family A protein [Sediminicoccus rosea]